MITRGMFAWPSPDTAPPINSTRQCQQRYPGPDPLCFEGLSWAGQGNPCGGFSLGWGETIPSLPRLSVEPSACLCPCTEDGKALV